MTNDVMLGLRYTGHPFIDVGLAAIAAFAGKRSPEQVTEEDLDRVVQYIEQNYVRPPLRGHMTMAFTSNAWFSQDAYNPDKSDLDDEQRAARRATRQKWADRHLRQWRTVSSADQRCVFTGLPVVEEQLSGSLMSGRAGRAQVPLLQSDDSINFFTYGSSGLPISGIALLALQFLPMGCAKVGLGLLAVHADDDTITYAIARKFFEQNNKNILQAYVAQEAKLPGASRSLKTLLIEALLEADQQRRQNERRENRGLSISAYNFNNGKSTGLVIYQLPMEISDFILTARSRHSEAWERLVGRGWQLPPQKAKGEEVFEPRRNYLYEDLFDVLHSPDNLRIFIRTYFLRIPQRARFEDDPRRAYRLRSDVDLISWSLIELFLAKVVHMDSGRLAQIRVLGDNFAVYVRKSGGKRFFRDFFKERRPMVFRSLLIKANVEHIKAGNESLFDMLTYAAVFEEGDEIMRRDWGLARDLVLMRMIDQLHDWLSDHPDAVPEEEEKDSSEAVASVED